MAYLGAMNAVDHHRVIVDVVKQTPEQIATRIVVDRKHQWWVECEREGCDNLVAVPKLKWVPTNRRDQLNDTTPYIKIVYTAPAAKHCPHLGCRGK